MRALPGPVTCDPGSSLLAWLLPASPSLWPSWHGSAPRHCTHGGQRPDPCDNRMPPHELCRTDRSPWAWSPRVLSTTLACFTCLIFTPFPAQDHAKKTNNIHGPRESGCLSSRQLPSLPAMAPFLPVTLCPCPAHLGPLTRASSGDIAHWGSDDTQTCLEVHVH